MQFYNFDNLLANTINCVRQLRMRKYVDVTYACLTQ